MRRPLASTAGVLTAAATLIAVPMPASADDPLPRVPPGFSVTSYQHIQGVGTSLAFGADTRDPSGVRLYATDFATASALGVSKTGRVMVIDDVGGTGSAPQVYASGFRNPLGVVAAPDGTLFVADAEASREGPFGTRSYGRVWRVEDTDGDGTGDTKTVVLRDLPNGRHNTNGMAFGPDGMLYVTNGNSTDDGVEGGDPEVVPWSGAVVRIDPAATDVSLADLDPRDALVATGMRNLYDVAFSPVDPTDLFIPTNGADDPESDDLLYATDIDDARAVIDPDTGEEVREPIIDDFGFPSCYYNVSARGNLEPYDNPNPSTIQRFGPCPVDTVPRPVASFGLHPSADGAAFQTTDAWGEDFKGDLFVAEFGNFFGDEVVGHEVVRVELDSTGLVATRQSEFLSGALPLDLTFDPAGNMYVLDFSGAIFKVTKVVEAPRVVDVQINAYQFIPATLVIPQGTTVRWTNQDVLGLIHNVTSEVAVRPDGAVETGSEIDSEVLTVGGPGHEYRFDELGTWKYICSMGVPHNQLMHGSITVVPAGG